MRNINKSTSDLTSVAGVLENTPKALNGRAPYEFQESNCTDTVAAIDVEEEF
jgi:hypothetical protein